MAQVAEAPVGDERPPETTLLDETVPQPGRVTVSAGMTLVSEYISRGIAFSDKPSLQPYVNVTVALPELTVGAVTDASLFVGSWNSIQDGPPGLGQPSSGPFSAWYETDLYAGAAIELNERWTMSATYYRYESPGNSFRGYNDLELIARFDDTDLWQGLLPLRNFTMSPALRMVQEAGRPGRADALYVQPSLTPSFDLGDEQNAVRIAVPLVIGLSDDYYDDVRGGKQTFGFFRTGVTVSGTPFPEEAGAFSVNGGFDLWLLNKRVANGLTGTEFVGRIGASWTF